MKQTFLIYAKKRCAYCKRALWLLKKETKKSEDLLCIVEFLDSNPNKLQGIKEKYKHQTVPIILFIEGEDKLEFIGGLRELKEWLRSRKKVVTA